MIHRAMVMTGQQRPEMSLDVFTTEMCLLQAVYVVGRLSIKALQRLDLWYGAVPTVSV